MSETIDTIIMGGTFDPVHIGHMHLADEVYNRFRPKRFLIIPSFISAHKANEEAVSAAHRIKMLEIACRNTDFIIETCEIDRGGISYSIDTVRYITDKYGLGFPPGLVIGDDLVEGFHRWNDAERLASEAEIILAVRNPAEGPRFEYPHVKLDNLMLTISSSDLRTRLNEGRACRYLLPPGVYEYILDNRLYGV